MSLQPSNIDTTPATTTVNKIGGKEMVQLRQVENLANALKENRESVVFVVSAFTGVTNTLIKAMDKLNSTNYSEDDVDTSFEPVQSIHDGIIKEFFHNEEFASQARETYQREYEALRQALITHKGVNNILMPRENSFEIRDQVIGFGDRMGAHFLSIFLEQQGYETHLLDNIRCDKCNAKEGPVSNDALHKNMQESITTRLINATEVRTNAIRILSGYIAGTPKGMAIDVGRSFTDATAVNTAEALKLNGEDPSEVTVWRSMEGVMTADPNILIKGEHEPFLHESISVDEGLEIASAGNSPIQLDALSIARRHERDDLMVADIRHPSERKGTRFINGDYSTSCIFKNIVINPNVDTITINIPQMANKKGFGAAIMQILSDHDLVLDGFFTEGTSVTFSLPLPKDNADKKALRGKILKAKKSLTNVEVDGDIYSVNLNDWSWNPDVACISIIGSEMIKHRGILANTTSILEAHGIDIKDISHNNNKRRIMVIIDSKNANKAVQLLHSIFVDADPTKIDEYKRRRDLQTDDLTGSFRAARAA